MRVMDVGATDGTTSWMGNFRGVSTCFVVFPLLNPSAGWL